MPTSGDLKSGDSPFPPPTPQQTDPAPNGNDLGHYYMNSYMKYMLSKSAIIILMPQKPYCY